jgi:hypothetical protein
LLECQLLSANADYLEDYKIEGAAIKEELFLNTLQIPDSSHHCAVKNRTVAVALMHFLPIFAQEQQVFHFSKNMLQLYYSYVAIVLNFHEFAGATMERCRVCRG